VWVTEKVDSCDPITKNDAGRAPASQLFWDNHAQLPAGRGRFRQVFWQVSRQARPQRTSNLPSLSAARAQADARYRGQSSNQLAALRFFFVKTLKRHQFRDFLPYPQDRRRLPTVLSRDEVSRLINASGTLFRRTLLMTLYGTGMRRSELAHLKVGDIDRQRMIIRVVTGKRGKDRNLPPEFCHFPASNCRVVSHLRWARATAALRKMQKGSNWIAAHPMC
jgi:site-specific recombinase XerC